MSSGVPLPTVSYRVVMPSMTAVATRPRFRSLSGSRRRRFSSQRPTGAHIFAQGTECGQGRRADARVAVRGVVDRRSEIADRGRDRPDAAVKPRSAAEAADDWDTHGGDYGRSRERARVSEIE